MVRVIIILGKKLKQEFLVQVKNKKMKDISTYMYYIHNYI